MPTVVTKTVKASGGDYTSLSNWEAGEQGDLVTLDEVHEAACSNFVDGTECAISGSTTDATHYMRAYAVDNHNGLYGTSSYRLETYGGPCLQLTDSFTRIEGLLIANTFDDANLTAVGFAPAADSPLLLRCIVRNKSTTSTYGKNGKGIRCGTDVQHDQFIIDCQVQWNWGVARTGNNSIACNHHTSGKTYLYNATVVGDGFNSGIYDGYQDVVAKNCLVSNTAADFYDLDTTSDYNASSDTSAPGTNSRTSQTFTFVDAATGDYHLASTDAGAKGYGTDLSADAHYAFDVDIDNQTRSAPWDIGADQYVSSASSQSGTVGIAAATAVALAAAVTLGGASRAATPAIADWTTPVVAASSAISVAAAAGTASWSARDATGVPGTVTVAMGAAVATGAAAAPSATPGATAATTTAASATVASEPPGGTAVISASVATPITTWTGPPLAGAAASSGTASVSTATWAAPGVSGTEAGTVAAGAAMAAWVAPPLSGAARASGAAGVASATWTTPTSTWSAVNRQSATAAVVTWQSPAAMATPGSTTASGAPAAAAWMAPSAAGAIIVSGVTTVGKYAVAHTAALAAVGANRDLAALHAQVAKLIKDAGVG